jgi:hypothetical protein
VDEDRVIALMCTADAYGVSGVVDKCVEWWVDKVDKMESGTTKICWKNVMEMPPSLLEGGKFGEWFCKSLTTGTMFQNVYLELAEAKCPVELVCKILASDDVRVWCEDVMLEFLFLCIEKHPDVWNDDKGRKRAEKLIRVNHLTKIALCECLVHACKYGLRYLAKNARERLSICKFYEKSKKRPMIPSTQTWSGVRITKDLISKNETTILADSKRLPFVELTPYLRTTSDKFVLGVFRKSTLGSPEAFKLRWSLRANGKQITKDIEETSVFAAVLPRVETTCDISVSMCLD